MKRVAIKILQWFLIAGFIAITTGFVENKTGKIKCLDIKINIVDSASNGFVQKGEILSILEKADMKILGFPLDSLNTNRLEHLIAEFPPVKRAEAYYNVNGILNIDVIQRKPLFRIMDSKGKGYYVDEEGMIMKLSDRYSSYVLLANGSIPENFKVRNGLNIFDEQKKNMPSSNKVLKDLYEFASYVNKNNFWQGQIVQVYVNEHGSYELIPRVGAHVIYLGDISNFRKKLTKLSAIYQKGFGKEGWNKYEKIYLQYSNQVVCTKR